MLDLACGGGKLRIGREEGGSNDLLSCDLLSLTATLSRCVI